MEAYWFFYENAGVSWNPKTQTQEEGRREGAEALLKAEFWANKKGCSFDWDHCDTTSREFTDEGEEYPLWRCVMRDLAGNVVASLSGIDFGLNGEPWGDPYRRVVEAELALEYMTGEKAS